MRILFLAVSSSAKPVERRKRSHRIYIFEFQWRYLLVIVACGNSLRRGNMRVSRLPGPNLRGVIDGRKTSDLIRLKILGNKQQGRDNLFLETNIFFLKISNIVIHLFNNGLIFGFEIGNNRFQI